MSTTSRILITLIMLILPALSECTSSEYVNTTCEISPVKEGNNATLIINFHPNLSGERSRKFKIYHRNNSLQEGNILLSCGFSYGNVDCDKSTCCTWENKVSDVFKVYILNVSQELEGEFWGLVEPASDDYQKPCNFTLKGVSTLTTSTPHGQSSKSSESPKKDKNDDNSWKWWEITLGIIFLLISSIIAYYMYKNFRSKGKEKKNYNKDRGSGNGHGGETEMNKPLKQLSTNGEENEQRQPEEKLSTHIDMDDSEQQTSAMEQEDKANIDESEGEKIDHGPDSSISFVAVDPGQHLRPSLPTLESVKKPNEKRQPEEKLSTHKDIDQSEQQTSAMEQEDKANIDESEVDKKDHCPDSSISFVAVDPGQHLGPSLPTPETVKKLMSTEQSHAHKYLVEDYWLQCIKKWYPKLHSQTYFLPPLHFNRVPYRGMNVAGKQVLVPQYPQERSVIVGRAGHGRSLTQKTFKEKSFILPVHDSVVRNDRALQRVLNGMHALADNEVMLVVSQLQFGKYIGKPSYAAAAARLPQPSTLREPYLQGDFDVLIIHSQLGLFTLEIRSVGENFGQLKMTEKEEDDILMKKLIKTTNQLNKSKVVLEHLTSDLSPEINITKCLVMPNITYTQLQRAIKEQPVAGQDLCKCLGADSVDVALKLCLLSDQLSGIQISSDVNDISLTALREWWQNVVKTSRPAQPMTPTLYEHLVARFCGPLTTVRIIYPRLNIRTLGEAVSETGERVARLVLFPEQIEVLNESPPRTFVSGPPGTGKTVVLIMQGLSWLQRGHDVHVISTWKLSRAATFAIEYHLQLEKSRTTSHVHRHQFDFDNDGDVESAINRLKTQSKGMQLCVIADEVINRYREPFTSFCDQLIKEIPMVYIWSASVYHDIRPLCLKEVRLTTPLRSPPVVVREVMKAWEIQIKQVHGYMVSDIPVPTDGPPVMRIKHSDGQLGHTGGRSLDCVECGHQVARVLKEELNVGLTEELNVGQTGDIDRPPPLQFRDVLVLCNGYPTDNSNGQVTTTVSGLVQGLRECHMPVRVVGEGDESAIRDTALGVSDMVTVAPWIDVQGLERKVVVVESEFDEKFNVTVTEKLGARSRCKSQLVVIDKD